MKGLVLLYRRMIRLAGALRVLETSEEVKESRPFYWFVMLFVAVIYAWTLALDGGLRSAPLPLALFTALMGLHAVLHWISLYIRGRSRWLLLYLVAQGATVLAVGFVARNQGMVLGLYMGMMGESIGLLERRRPAAVAAAAYFALFVFNAGLVWGWGILPTLLPIALPTAIFVAVYVVMFMRQADARRRAQELLRDLEVAHHQLARYAEQAEALTLAAERQRMARELHDTLAQGLAGLILQLEALEAQLARGDVRKAATIATQAKERARGTLAEARRTIDDLRQQPELSDSLLEAVRREAERFSMATGIPCSLDLPPALSLPAPVAEHASRCVAEGLANVARHARASHVAVSMALHDGSLLVAVRDDGAGFDPAVAAGQAGHYGLLGLRERARLAGGTLDVESAVGAGTTLKLRLPLGGESTL